MTFFKNVKLASVLLVWLLLQVNICRSNSFQLSKQDDDLDNVIGRYISNID